MGKCLDSWLGRNWSSQAMITGTENEEPISQKLETEDFVEEQKDEEDIIEEEIEEGNDDDTIEQQKEDNNNSMFIDSGESTESDNLQTTAI